MTKSLLAIIIIAAVALAGCTGERHNRAFGGLDSIAETSPGVAVARPTARATITARRCGLPRAMMGAALRLR